MRSIVDNPGKTLLICVLFCMIAVSCEDSAGDIADAGNDQGPDLDTDSDTDADGDTDSDSDSDSDTDTETDDVYILGAKVEFLSLEDCELLFGSSDAYTTGLSIFDRGVRLNTLEDTTEADYLSLASSACMEWTDAEMQTWSYIAEQVAIACDGFNIDMPQEVLLMKSSGAEEFGYAYTRANAIVITPTWMSMASDSQIALMAHELWHVVTRNSPDIREDIYGIIDFHPVDGVVYPSNLLDTKFTNPDAIDLDHYITVEDASQTYDVVPILQFTESLATILGMSAGPFNASDVFLLDVDTTTGSLISSTPILASDTNYFDLASVNTNYTIHPEEVIADNFSLLLLRRLSLLFESVDDPTVLDDIETILSQ